MELDLNKSYEYLIRVFDTKLEALSISRLKIEQGWEIESDVQESDSYTIVFRKPVVDKPCWYVFYEQHNLRLKAGPFLTRQDAEKAKVDGIILGIGLTEKDDWRFIRVGRMSGSSPLDSIYKPIETGRRDEIKTPGNAPNKCILDLLDISEGLDTATPNEDIIKLTESMIQESRGIEDVIIEMVQIGASDLALENLKNIGVSYSARCASEHLDRLMEYNSEGELAYPWNESSTSTVNDRMRFGRPADLSDEEQELLNEFIRQANDRGHNQ